MAEIMDVDEEYQVDNPDPQDKQGAETNGTSETEEMMSTNNGDNSGSEDSDDDENGSEKSDKTSEKEDTESEKDDTASGKDGSASEKDDTASGNDGSGSEKDGTASETDNSANNNTENSNDNSPPSNKDYILKLMKKYCKEGVDDATLVKKLDDLGVDVLSDLDDINLDSWFEDIMKPAKLSKFKKEFDRVTKLTPAKPATPQLLDFKTIFSPSQLSVLNGKKRMSKNDYLDITRRVGDELYFNYKTASMKVCKKVANQLLIEFKDSLTSPNVKGCSALTQIIYRRCKYKRRLDLMNKNTPGMAGGSLRKFSKRQNYALESNRDLPSSFPGDETRDTQEAKRVEMVEMRKSAVTVNWKKVEKLMQETYVAQRLAIHSKNNAGEVIADWPFFGKYSILRNHFHYLMNLDPNKLVERLRTFVPEFLKFLEYDVMKPSRRGEALQTAETIKEHLIKYKNCTSLSSDIEFVTLIYCVSLKLKQNLKQLFLFFDETTSYDEVQASSKLPKDGSLIVAVLGKSLFDVPQCFIVVDRCIISPISVKPLRAILSVFMCYFVFKAEYPKGVGCLLEFIQRAIFEIDGDPNSSRMERKKNKKGHYDSNPQGPSCRYSSLIAAFDDYKTIWAPA